MTTASAYILRNLGSNGAPGGHPDSVILLPPQSGPISPLLAPVRSLENRDAQPTLHHNRPGGDCVRDPGCARTPARAVPAAEIRTRAGAAGSKSRSPPPPKAYKPLVVQLPKPLADPDFEAFRKQIIAIAQKKDRAGLAQLVAQNFFWIPEDKDAADKRKPGIDNLARAIGLEGRDSNGWEVLATFAAEPTADASPDRPGAICAPGQPTFDEKAADELINVTQTDPAEWGYTTKDGIEVHAEPNAASAVIEKLGLQMVRAYPDNSPANAVQADFIRIVTPSGKLGFILVDTLAAAGQRPDLLRERRHRLEDCRRHRRRDTLSAGINRYGDGW